MDWLPIGLIGLGAFTIADLLIFRTVFPPRTAEHAAPHHQHSGMDLRGVNSHLRICIAACEVTPGERGGFSRLCCRSFLRPAHGGSVGPGTPDITAPPRIERLEFSGPWLGHFPERSATQD